MCNYFQEKSTAKVFPGRSLLHCQYFFAKLLQLFQRSLQPTTAKEPEPTMTLTIQINIVNNKIISMFCHNIVLLCTESTNTLSPTHKNVHTDSTEAYTETYMSTEMCCQCWSDDFIGKIVLAA